MKKMKKAMTMFWAALFASFIFTSCVESKKEKVDSTMNLNYVEPIMNNGDN